MSVSTFLSHTVLAGDKSRFIQSTSKVCRLHLVRDPKSDHQMTV
jgi:hypothetical protein